MKELYEWLLEHKPAIACSLDYCNTNQEVRRLLNYHTGLNVYAFEDREQAFSEYLEAFKKQELERLTAPSH